MEFTYHPAERLYIDSIASRLTDSERLARRELIEELIGAGKPVFGRGFARKLSTRHGLDGEATLASLVEKKVAVVDDKGFVKFVYPVSAMPNTHRVQLQDGRSFHPMCAIDGLGSHFTLQQDVEVTSSCHYCKAPITVTVKDGQIAHMDPATAHALHADLNNVENWATGC